MYNMTGMGGDMTGMRYDLVYDMTGMGGVIKADKAKLSIKP